MARSSGRSFPRLAYDGKTSGSPNIAAMPLETVGLSDHLAVFGPPDQYFEGLHHLKKQLSEVELFGRGGAAFPLSRKLAGFEQYRGKTVVVANGSESEYLSHKDKTLIARHPHLVLDGLAILGSALGAKQGFVHLKTTNSRGREIIDRAIRERRGFDPFPIETSATVAEVGYVSGAESAVISAINRSGGRPIYLPERPISRGVRKRPTLVANVETLAHLALLARFGSEWFGSIGSAGDIGTRLMTVTVPDGRHAVLEVIAGTPFAEIFDVLGIRENSINCALIGGYFGQVVDREKLMSLRASHHFLKEAGIPMGAGVIALSTGCPVVETARVIEYLAGQSAGQCGPCYRGLPELARSWRSVSDGDVTSRSISRVSELCDEIFGRGGCAMPNGAVLLARSSLSRFRAELLVHQGGSCSFGSGSSRLVPEPGALVVG